MDNKKIIIALFVIVFLLSAFGGTFLFLQQKKINDLSYQIESGALLDLLKNKPIDQDAPATLTEEAKLALRDAEIKGIMESRKQVVGEIKSVSADVISVSASVEKVGQAKENGDGILQPVMEQKNFSVKFDEKTKFENKKKNELKEGDVVLITSESSIYGGLDLVALSVKYLDPDAVEKGASEQDISVLQKEAQAAAQKEQK